MTTYFLYLILFSSESFTPIGILTPYPNQIFSDRVKCAIEGGKLAASFERETPFIYQVQCSPERKNK